jgi:DNA-binding XRE family transcriptional regulator
VGCTKEAISKIENNLVDPKLGTAMRICKYFKLKVDEVFET